VLTYKQWTDNGRPDGRPKHMVPPPRVVRRKTWRFRSKYA